MRRFLVLLGLSALPLLCAGAGVTLLASERAARANGAIHVAVASTEPEGSARATGADTSAADARPTAATQATPPTPDGATTSTATDHPIESPDTTATPPMDLASSCPFGAIAVFEGGRPVSEDDPVQAPRKRAWEEQLGGEIAARPAVRARLRAVPTRLRADRDDLPGDDRRFLQRLAKDTWTGLDALTDKDNGLPVDHVHLIRGDGEQAPEWRVGDYTNITNVGVHLIAIAAAVELELLKPAEGMERIRRILDTLDVLETAHGLFFNYYDTTSLERTSNLLSFVDTSWLTAGLMVVRMAFPELRERCSALIDRTDYGFFWDAKRRQMSHGYYVHRDARSRYHYGVLYTEARLGNVIAIGKGDVPEDAWFSMVRTYPPECEGQNGRPLGVATKNVRGHAVSDGHYEWGGVSFVPSWGGSMFEALMPALVLDEQRHAPRSLGANDVAHTIVQRRFATEELGYPVWGLSPSITPRGDDYSEYGARPLGARGYRAGAVTPHAAALALLTTPVEAVANLRALVERYDVYGEYGLYDSVDPVSGQVAASYLALDQSMVFIALANYLKPHCVQERFGADPIVQHALPVIAAEDFFE